MINTFSDKSVVTPTSRFIKSTDRSRPVKGSNPKHPVSIFISGLICLMLVYLSPLYSYGNDNAGHRIEIHLEGMTNSECYLAYHFGNRQYIRDTTLVDSEGRALFSGRQKLPAGMYIIVLEDHRNFEVIIDREEQHFTVRADPDDLSGTVSFEGSPSNSTFYSYLAFISGKNQVRQELEQELRSGEAHVQRQEEIRAKIESIDREVKDKQDRIIDSSPGALLSRIILAQRDPELPDPPVGSDGETDTDLMYRIYKERYFDNIDFSDQRLLYTPVYHSRLRIFFNNVIVQHPDSLIIEADRVIDMARANQEVFRYTVWFITNNAESSQVMGMDKLLVHMIDNYYLTDEVDWVEEERLERLKEMADNIRPLMMGNIAPDFTIQGRDGSPVSLHGIDAEFIILYFWDSECVFCREAMPVVREASERLSDEGVRVFAVNTENDRQRWYRALEEYPSTWIHANDTGILDAYNIYAIPHIFILDSDKKIIAKDIGAENIETFIRRHISDKK